MTASSQFSCSCYIFTGSIAHSAQRQYKVAQRAILRFFAPQGRYVAPIGVKFGMKEWTVYSFTPNLIPVGAEFGGTGSQKTENFTDILQNFGIKTSRRGVSLARFLRNLQSL